MYTKRKFNINEIKKLNLYLDFISLITPDDEHILFRMIPTDKQESCDEVKFTAVAVAAMLVDFERADIESAEFEYAHLNGEIGIYSTDSKLFKYNNHKVYLLDISERAVKIVNKLNAIEL